MHATTVLSAYIQLVFPYFDRAVPPPANHLVSDEVNTINLIFVTGKVGVQFVSLHRPYLEHESV